MATKLPAFALRFPLGVISENGALAYIGDEIPGIAALNLQSGNVLWRVATSGRPVAADAQRIIVLRQARDFVLELDVLDAHDGTLLATFAVATSFPTWVKPSLKSNENFAYRCALAGANLDIEWCANQHYEGGAPPDRKVIEHSRRLASGVLHIDLASGSSRSEARKVDLRADAAAPISKPAGPAREVCIHGQCMYYLLDQAIDANSGRTTLRAMRCNTDEMLWEFAVRNWKASRPRALRP